MFVVRRRLGRPHPRAFEPRVIGAETVALIDRDHRVRDIVKASKRCSAVGGD